MYKKNYYQNLDFEYIKFLYGKNLHPVFATQLDVFPCIGDANVSDVITLWELLQKIRYNIVQDLYFNYLLINKYVNGSKNLEYEKLKNSLPTVCYNATFSGYKNIKHLKSTTNLMFLDIDDFGSTEEVVAYKNDITLRYDWIVACNLSLSRLGLHIIILVDEILDNTDFNNKYDFISKEFFEGRLDSNAKSLTRFAIVPYDYNIFINESPNVLEVNRLIKANQKGTSSVYRKEEIITTACTFFTPSPLREVMNDAARNDGLRFNQNPDASYFSDPDKPIYDPNGIDVIEVNVFPYLKCKVSEGARNATIGAISAQMIYLNPEVEKKESVHKLLQWFNKELCDPPLSFVEVSNSFNANWQKHLDKQLDVAPFFRKKRSFWSPDCKLRANDKRKITCKIKNQPIVDATKQRIYSAIDELRYNETKITQKKVAEMSGLNIQTVKKYWKDFKQHVNEIYKINKN